MDSSDGEGAIFAYLIDVAPGGVMRYVTEGCLSAPHRAEATDAAARRARASVALPQTAPSLPLRTFRRVDAAPPLPRAGEPGATMRIALLAAAHTYLPGHRVALALSGADGKHFQVAAGTEGRLMGVSWGGGDGALDVSRLELPVLSQS